MEIISEVQNKVKRMKRTEDSLRDLWDNIKPTNIWIIGVPEKEKKGMRHFWRDYSWKFPQHGKGNSQSSPSGTESPIQVSPRRNMSRHILVELTKTKHKERILKAINIIQGKPDTLNSWSFSRNSAREKGMARYI